MVTVKCSLCGKKTYIFPKENVISINNKSYVLCLFCLEKVKDKEYFRGENLSEQKEKKAKVNII